MLGATPRHTVHLKLVSPSFPTAEFVAWILSAFSYSILRHPSYVGFYYWSIATQLLLNNFVHTMLFAGASTLFFRKRIPYEEESLMQYFPDQYPAYRKKTWIGIPFVPTVPLETTTTTTKTHKES